ncbi:MAG TPA: DUF5343 domain-containing protein [Allosphingosinicella sp.]
MAIKPATSTKSEEAPKPDAAPKAGVDKKQRKDVPGNFSYTFTPGRFKDMLQAMIGAERPPTFNRDFIETVLNIKGGTVSGFPALLKRLGFLGSDNSPTELYGQFQADGSRPAAALAGLRNGFAELFKRNAHVHRADDAKIKDYLVQITGRKKDDQVVAAILGTFNAVRSFVGEAEVSEERKTETQDRQIIDLASDSLRPNLGLSYHINIVLPETKDVAVFNAIFQSLKQNLLS